MDFSVWRFSVHLRLQVTNPSGQVSVLSVDYKIKKIGKVANQTKPKFIKNNLKEKPLGRPTEF